MSHQQLTEGQRYQISALKAVGLSISNIAAQIGCHRSTVYRELSRNTLSNRTYCPKHANQQAVERRKLATKYCIPNNRIDFIEYLLQHDWSPEQISHVLSHVDEPVSHEWIYRHVAQDKAQGGSLYKHLRQGHKRYRKGTGKRWGGISNAISIDDRPGIVDSRERFGDWEADTVLGKQGTGAVVSLLERSTRCYLVKKVPNKSAKTVSNAIIEMLSPYKEHVHTITFDNGREFSLHQDIAYQLDTDVYFAHPYSSWERGANENANGLLRQYIPKGTDLREVTDEQILFAQNRLNYRPKKCLGFRQPVVLFNENLRAA